MTRSTKKRAVVKRESFSNRLPSHVGDAFRLDLVRTISKLADAYGGFRTAYLIDELESKYLDDTKTSPDTRQRAAITKWLDVERNNAKTNQRLLHHHDDSLGWVSAATLVARTRKIIGKVLGPFRYDSILCLQNHTNGASTRVRRGPTAATYKFSGEAHLTSGALSHWTHVAKDSRLDDQTISDKPESVMFTVPKKSTIDRVACKEPEINMLLQRSVGKFIRRRLKHKVGIDLRDQTVNQKLAKTALEQGLATIDLSSASDSVTHQLVLTLLPWEYYSLMDDLRVKATDIPNYGLHDLEMFSSMGNGFTFELESLLFYSITKAVMELSGFEGRPSVYGDDIIAPSAVVPRLARVLHYFGFTLNRKKTHWKGLFRESCGAHYHDGVDVTPFYIRKPVREITELIRLLNQLLKWDSIWSKSYPAFWTTEIALFHQKWARHVPRKLHGGNDCSRIDALVTGDKPDHVVDLEPERMRRCRSTRRMISLPVRMDNDGALTAWLVSAHERESDPWFHTLKQGADITFANREVASLPPSTDAIVVTQPQSSAPRLKKAKSAATKSGSEAVDHDIYFVLTEVV